MGIAKNADMEEKSDTAIKVKNRYDGDRKKLQLEGEFAIDCPHCGAPLSHENIKSKICKYCNYEFK